MKISLSSLYKVGKLRIFGSREVLLLVESKVMSLYYQADFNPSATSFYIFVTDRLNETFLKLAVS